MKQSITKQQWEELGEEEKNLLDGYFGQYAHNYQSYKTIEILENGEQKDSIKWWALNIGQMIEFLGSDLMEIANYGNEWGVSYKMTNDYWESHELANALWEAVKYKLKDLQTA